MTERMLSQVQTGEVGLLLYIVHGINPCEKMCNLEIRKALYVEPPLSPNREILATLVLPCVQNVPRKIGEASSAGYTQGKAAQRSSKTWWTDYISDLALYHLGMEPAEVSEICFDHKVFQIFI